MNKIQPSVKLAEPIIFPEQCAETCREFLRQHWQRRRWEMQESFGFHNLPLMTDEQLAHTILAENLAVIARAAAGETKYSEWNADYLAETIRSVMESIFAPSVLYSYQIQEGFWDTSFGQMVARARLWMRQDELITLKEAAQALGVTIQAASKAVKNGRLTRYVDPDAPQRQGRVLVSQQEVEGMKQ